MMLGLGLGALVQLAKTALGLGDRIAQLKVEQVRAGTDEEKARIQAEIDHLELQREILVAEQQSATTRWVRPAFALIVWIVLAKLMVWDKVVGSLVLWLLPGPWSAMFRTDTLTEEMWWFIIAVVTAYFLTRPFEKRGRR